MNILKSIPVPLALIALALSISGCDGDDTHESLISDLLDFMDESAKAMAEATDEASAKAAAAKITALEGDLEELAQRAEALGKSSDADKTAIIKKFKERAQDIAGRMLAKMIELSEKPEVLNSIEAAMDQLEPLVDKITDQTGDMMTKMLEMEHNKPTTLGLFEMLHELSNAAARPPFVGKLEEDLEATNRDGSNVHLSELKGDVWLASFLYSNCPKACAANSQILLKVYERFGEDPRFHIVLFSAHSSGDTPDKIAAFMARQRIDQPEWWYLTAKDNRLNAYMATFLKLTNSDLAAQVGVEHDHRVALVDGKANVRGYYDLLALQGFSWQLSNGKRSNFAQKNMIRMR
ncbi:MAG: cytochrome oxidase Cu insertion factor (SCO1/SenC/PrrC family) [Verrucomicrobiales bacterium]|jgi:cytochrome oxidase Cu insertion factor (SCO1/SenC/PrrC family)